MDPVAGTAVLLHYRCGCRTPPAMEERADVNANVNVNAAAGTGAHDDNALRQCESSQGAMPAPHDGTAPHCLLTVFWTMAASRIHLWCIRRWRTPIHPGYTAAGVTL